MLFLKLLVPLCPFPHLFGISFPLQSALPFVFRSPSHPPPPHPVQQGLSLMTPCSHAHPFPENLSRSPLASSLPTAPAWILSGLLTHVCPSPTPAIRTFSTKKPERVSDHSDDPVTYLTLSSEPYVATQWLGIKANLLLERQAHRNSPCPSPRLLSLYAAIFLTKLPAATPLLVSHVGCAISHF